MCTHARQVENQRCSRTGRVKKNHKILRKNTIFNEHPVFVLSFLFIFCNNSYSWLLLSLHTVGCIKIIFFSSRFPCTICNYAATRNEYLKKHMADKHGSGKVLNLTKGGGVDGGAGDGGVVGLEDRKPIGLHLPTPFIA